MSNNESNVLDRIVTLIKNSKSFFIAGHVNPDGDSLGSALAFSSVLNRLNKSACVYSINKIPSKLKFLQSNNQFKHSVQVLEVFDCAILLEVSKLSRLGNIIQRNRLKKIINIDHHVDCDYFGDINYIIPTSSSTAELVFKIFQYMKISLTNNEAECLYTGILTDTGCFQQPNTTIDAHTASIQLMKYNLDVNKIYKEIYANNTIEQLKLLGLALYNMKIAINHTLAYISITKKMLYLTKTNHNDIKGIVNYTLRTNNIKIGCLFEEIDSLTTKISFRSVNSVNVLKIAKQFNGGGHINASGCIIKNNLNISINLVISYIKDELKVL
ncbi:MAG: bifunctional oligoribonuclease/PAP phosphatase NrnA [Endomicrobium sp.]|jgi:phosphoesterase RecJ-like protein|nr:bifunctional oligoribonuclease/PAP phosphatase NrnA [Endomicrobium sp.]